VTGVAGFLGSHLAEALLADGHRVVGVDNFCTGSKYNLDRLTGLEFIEADVCEVVPDLPLDFNVVYHLASPASPDKYMQLALETMKVNTTATLSLLEYCSKTGARLVFASTSEVYGDPQLSPQSETYWGNVNTIGPRSVYDEAKRFGETLIAHFQRQGKADAGIVRIFNTYGPGMDPFDGRVVSNLIRQALREEPMTIYGSGKQTRSFCYVDDLIRAVVAMGNSPHSGPINLGNPTEINIFELASTIKRVTGSDSTIVYKALPQDDPSNRRPDITEARKVLNWSPIVHLEEGIRRTVEWLEEFQNS
jgi:dTDP-glucose 4,6-dehydratase